MFPLSIKFKRELNVDSEIEQIISIIEKELIRLKIDDIRLSNFEIYFQNSLFNGQGRNHLMAPVDKGYFKFNRKLKMLEYSFSLIRTFYITLIIGLFFGLISQRFWIGTTAFLWIFGMNWLIAIIRHYLFINKLKRKLSEKIIHTTPYKNNT